MKKLKIPLAIILTLGLLYVFACLPGIVSGILDLHFGKTPSYNDMLTVKLDLSQDHQEMRFPEKLLLLRDAQPVKIDPSQATMPEGDVEDIVNAFLQLCENAGIYESFKPSHMYMQAKLMYDFSDASKHLVIWTVTMINKNEPNQNVVIDVDDETGKILCIKYNIYRSYSMDDVWERNKVVMERFAKLYFDQLGMPTITDAAGSNPSFVAGYEYGEIDGGVSEAIYTLADSEIGEFAIHITVDGAGGFRITIL